MTNTHTPTRTRARSQVQNLLAEGVESARLREAAEFDRLAGTSANQIVLFGAGGLGRRALAGLRASGIEPLAFSDNNSELWNREVLGLKVLSPKDAVDRFGRTAIFVVTIWGAGARERTADRIKHLQSLGCATVAPFAPLFWKYPEHVLPHYGADLPHKAMEQAPAVLDAFELWHDEQSRHEYVAQLRWRLLFDCDGLPAPDKEAIYFPQDLIRLRADEVFVDCGAFDGDTVRLFLRHCNSAFGKVIALEPDPENYSRLRSNVDGLAAGVRQRIDLACAAAGARQTTVSFSAQGTASSFVGQGDLHVQCVRLDDYLADVKPTFIKMDIEGAELDALRGASSLIRECAPILAISCYHRQDHLWAIPLLIRSFNSNYRFFLRPHDWEMWDLVCYGIPESR